MKKTQAAIARNIGYSSRQINRIFQKNRLPSVKLARKLEEQTGVPWSAWLDGSAPTWEELKAMLNREPA